MTLILQKIKVPLLYPYFASKLTFDIAKYSMLGFRGQRIEEVPQSEFYPKILRPGITLLLNSGSWPLAPQIPDLWWSTSELREKHNHQSNANVMYRMRISVVVCWLCHSNNAKTSSQFFWPWSDCHWRWWPSNGIFDRCNPSLANQEHISNNYHSPKTIQEYSNTSPHKWRNDNVLK